jgi:hypothetical protein
MSRFSASDAALSGFRFIGREPRTIMVWAGVLFLYEVIYGLLVVGLAHDKLSAVQTFRETNNTDPEAALAMLPAVSPLLLVTFIALLFVAAVMFTAAYRAQLEPEPDKWGHLRVGRDEVRFAALILIWIALSVGASLIITFFTALLNSLGQALPPIIALPYTVVLIIAALAAFIYPLVRLSLSMPMTYADAHVRLLESWKPTRGHVWPLLGAYVLAAIMIIVLLFVVWSVVAVIAAVIAVAVHFPITALSGLFQRDTSSLAAYFSPLSILAALLNSGAWAAGLAIFCAPVAEAYRSLEEGSGRHAGA